MYTWSPGDVISSARLNDIEGDRAPIAIESIEGQPNGVLASHPTGTFQMATANIGDYVYLFGGVNSSNVSQTTVYRYSVSGNSYTAMTSLASARPYKAVAVAGDIYLIHRGSPAETLRYNVATNTYTTLTAYTTSGCSQIEAVGTNIFFMTASGTALVKYNTVGAAYTVAAAIPTSGHYRFATDGTNLYMFRQTTSYRYNVAANSYTSIAGIDAASTTPTAFDSYTQSALYVGPSGTARNRNKIFFQIQYSTNVPPPYFDQWRVYVYDIAANTISTAAQTPAVLQYGSFCAIPDSANESIICFGYAIGTVTPYANQGVIRFTSYISAFEATEKGIAVAYDSGKTLRNETTGVTGTTVSFKSGDVLTNNDSRGLGWGGSAVASFDAIIIQKG